MEPVSNQEFFSNLASLIEKRQQGGHGSVFLTQKRLSKQGPDGSTQDSQGCFSDLSLREPQPILVRASDGDTQDKKRTKNKKHVKFSTIVQPNDIETFFLSYAETCKTGMQSLKKRDRSKRKRVKKKTATAEDEKKS